MARRERKPRQKKYRFRRHFAPTKGRVGIILAGLVLIGAAVGALWFTDQHRQSVAKDGDCQTVATAGQHTDWGGRPGYVNVPADPAHKHPAVRVFTAQPAADSIQVCWRGDEAVTVDSDGSSNWLMSGLSGDALGVVGFVVIVFAFLIPMGPKGPRAAAQRPGGGEGGELSRTTSSTSARPNGRWVISTTVRPPAAASRSSVIAAAVGSSRCSVGSSSTRIGVSRSRTRASASRRR